MTDFLVEMLRALPSDVSASITLDSIPLPEHFRWLKGDRPIRHQYLYLRTKTNVEHEDETLDTLSEVYDDKADLLEISRKRNTWGNGFVLRLTTHLPLPTLADKLKPGLDCFDAWLLHDAEGAYVESVTAGLAAMFYRSDKDGQRHTRTAQVFLMFKAGDNDPDQAADHVRTALGYERCAPVFHMKGGKILALASGEPASIVHRRCQEEIAALDQWAICDHQGMTLSSSGPKWRIWSRIDLAELWFEPD